ncbi:MAG: TIR domain-containing protein [Bacteroidota bacterium]
MARSKSRFRQYWDQNEENDVDFTVFIIHGKSLEIPKVERFIRDELKFNTIILQDSYTGRNIIDKFKEKVWDHASCAIAIMSPDDQLNDGNFRARQNVIFEIGYCSGVFDSYYNENEEDDADNDDDDNDSDSEVEPVIILKERSIDMRDLSDLLGVEYLEYKQGTIETTFIPIRKALNALYEELGGEEEE